MPPISIYESFNEAVYRPRQPNPLPAAHISSDTTRACKPPRFLLNVDVSVWKELANTILRRHEPYLRSIRLPARETGAVYMTEGDVVAGAVLELHHPVHMAIGREMQTIQYGSEVSRLTARVDKIYFKRSQNQQHDYVAAVDYKRVGVIINAEFRSGIVNDSASFNIAMDNKRSMAFGQNTNASILLKQGVHYSEVYGTPFVALFDMRTLVLLVFADRKKYQGGDYAYVTVVDDSKDMRKALLGFLSLAASHKDVDQDGWKMKMVSTEQRAWFESAGKAWGSGAQGPGARKSDRNIAQNTQ